MANSKITWADKESLVTDPTIAEKNKVTDSNMNEIKSVVNENADQVILSDTEPTSADNEIWIDTSSNATYINQEVNIGATNPSNTRTWFKQSKNINNLYISNRSSYGVSISLINGVLSINGTTNGEGTIVGSLASPISVITLKAGTYTFSARILSGTFQRTNKDVAIYFRNATDGTIYFSSSGELSYRKTAQVTFTETTSIYFQMYTNGSGTIFNNLEIGLQIEKGETETTFEPYITPEIIIDNREIYSKIDTGWLDLELKNGTTARSDDFNYKPQVRVIGNQAYIKGQVAIPNASSTTTIATIPDICKPIYEIAFPNINNLSIWGGTSGNIVVSSNSSQEYRNLATQYLVN